MKICLVSGSWPDLRCGVGDYTARLAETLSALPCQITVITSPSAVVQRLPAVKVRPEVPTWRIWGLWTLLRIIFQEQPAVVHLQYPSLNFNRGLAPNLLFLCLRLLKPHISRVLTLHEFALFSWMGKWRLLPTLLAANQVICTNHFDRHALRRFCMMRWLAGRISVIPLGSNIDPSNFIPAKPQQRIRSHQQQRTWLIHFGTIMPNKGWEIIIPALAQLRREDENIGVLAVAEINPQRYAYHQQVASLIQKAELQEHIHFTGYLTPPQVTQILCSHALALHPYRFGACLNRSSLVVVLAHGLAVITTQPKFPLEGLRHGKELWLIKPEDPAALAESIRFLLVQPKLVSQLQQGASQAAQRFTWTRIARRMQKIYASQARECL